MPAKEQVLSQLTDKLIIETSQYPVNTDYAITQGTCAPRTPYKLSYLGWFATNGVINMLEVFEAEKQLMDATSPHTREALQSVVERRRHDLNSWRYWVNASELGKVILKIVPTVETVVREAKKAGVTAKELKKEFLRLSPSTNFDYYDQKRRVNQSNLN